MCKFLGVHCKYSVKTCQGIKVCELAGSQIISATHKEVNMEKDFLMKNNSVLTQQQIIINTQMYVIFTYIFFFNLIENLKVII
jgi:hypothetical protein